MDKPLIWIICYSWQTCSPFSLLQPKSLFFSKPLVRNCPNNYPHSQTFQTPPFSACSTNMVEGLVTSCVEWRQVDVWRCSTSIFNKQAYSSSFTITQVASQPHSLQKGDTCKCSYISTSFKHRYTFCLHYVNLRHQELMRMPLPYICGQPKD